MEFRILGPLEVIEHGQPLPLGPPKQRMLLAALLLRPNEVVSNDELTDALWGEHPPERAAKSLQVYVWRLRKLLGREVLQTRPPGYALSVSPEDLDLNFFESLRHAARGRNPIDAAGVLREALGLFRGRPLADFAYEAFAVAECARIEELRFQTLEDRVQADLELGRHTELVGELESLVAGQPLRERLRAQLMLSLYRCGRQAEALTAYQDARGRLVEELGIEPGRELQALQTAILRQDSSLDLASPPVDEEPLHRTSEDVEPEATRRERKFVTVLSVGITRAPTDEPDPELALAAAAPFHAAARQEIEGRGGVVERLSGDGLLAAFGAPLAHEDDPERAVRAALAIRRWVSDRRDGSRIWVGVDTALALVVVARAGNEPAVAAGAVVDAAQLLQAAAPVNGILVGDLTCRATRDRFEYREAEPVAMRSRPGEFLAWEVLDERPRRGTDVREPRAPLAGRRHELGILVSILRRVCDECSPQLVTLVGVPGIGKSRLVFELFEAAARDGHPTTWHQGRCLPYGEGIGLWALGEVVKSEAGILESDSPAEAHGKLSVAVAGVVDDALDREWVTNRLAPLVGVQLAEASTTAHRDESFAAWRRFFELLARDRPLVLVFEDLHWADDTLLDFVDELADRALAAPLLVVCTARPELHARRPGWGGGKPNSISVTMQPLSDSETEAILAGVLEEPLDAQTREALLSRAAGNPLYAEQFARSLAEGGTVDELPETVHGIIAGRLDGLSEAEKTLLQDAAVVGKVFWLGALESIGGVPAREGEPLLRALERKEFVQRVGRPSIAGETEYAFRHVLLRDVAYEQIPRADRAAKHRRAALWIERISERVTDHAEILIHHYGQAFDLLQVLGSKEGGEALETPYRRFLLLAGDRALQLDVGRAEAYFGRALDLVPPDHTDRATVLTKTAEVAWLAGRYSQAEDRYEAAIGELRAQGRTVDRAGAMVNLSIVHAFRGETGRARALLDDAVGLLEREAAGPELARACAQMARRHTLAERWDEALSWSERALALAERFDIEEISSLALQYRGFAKVALGDLRGVDDLRDALRTSLDHGLGLESVRAHENLGIGLWLTEGPAQGLEFQQAAIDFGEHRGVTSLVMLGKAQSMGLLFDLGRWDAVVDRADEVIAWDRTLGGSYSGVMALNAKAQVCFLCGEQDEASSLSVESLARARRVEDPLVLAPALVVAAMIEHERGNGDGVRDLVEEFSRVVPSATLEGGCLLPEVIRLCAAVGDLDVMERIISGRSEALTRHRNGLLTARATVARAKGSLDEAEHLYEEATRGWGEYGCVLEHAHALLGLGRCRAALGRADVCEPLTAAADLFARLGARTLAAETEELLAELA